MRKEMHWLAFIMLVSALIHREMENAVKNIEDKSVQTCLLEAKMIKAHKRRNTWTVCNCLPKKKELFTLLNTPLTV